MSVEAKKLKEIISEVLDADVGELSPDTELAGDLGLDSLEIFQIIIGIEEKFGIVLEDEDIEDIVTVGDAVSKIRRGVPKGMNGGVI